MSETSARLGLPLIQPGQAQKEIAHNEALTELDLLVQPAITAVGADTPPASPVIGQCWIVGSSPSGVWSGQAQTLAGWTSAGWRFIAPFAGLTVWGGETVGSVRWTGSAWAAGAITGTILRLGGDQVVGARRAAISDPVGGATADSQARTAIAAILSTLRGHGLIAT